MTTGQYPDPTHTLLHLSDTHFVEDARALYGAIDSDANLDRLLTRLDDADVALDAVVVTGDLADNGAPDAYRRLRTRLERFADSRGCAVVWVMGNHDDRSVVRTELLDEPAGTASLDRVHDLGGLRVIALDSTVPGQHHGEIDAAQLEWLRAELATPAEHGTVLALHHPPVPTTLPLLQMVELRDAAPLGEVVRGTDVRGVLAGHFHYATHSTFAGVPVSVGAATCYTQDLALPAGHTRAHDAAQAASLVHVYPDRLVHSQVPVAGGTTVYEVSAEQIRQWVDAARAGDQVDSGLLDS